MTLSDLFHAIILLLHCLFVVSFFSMPLLPFSVHFQFRSRFLPVTISQLGKWPFRLLFWSRVGLNLPSNTSFSLSLSLSLSLSCLWVCTNVYINFKFVFAIAHFSFTPSESRRPFPFYYSNFLSSSSSSLSSASCCFALLSLYRLSLYLHSPSSSLQLSSGVCFKVM